MNKKYYDSFAIMGVITDLMERIGNLPAPDVVEVVRCKDCRFFQTDECRYDWSVQNVNDYCSKGERKEGQR